MMNTDNKIGKWYTRKSWTHVVCSECSFELEKTKGQRAEIGVLFPDTCPNCKAHMLVVPTVTHKIYRHMEV